MEIAENIMGREKVNVKCQKILSGGVDLCREQRVFFRRTTAKFALLPDKGREAARDFTR